jgi:hypothetical protein
VKILYKIFWVVMPCNVPVDANASEDLAASIFRVRGISFHRKLEIHDLADVKCSSIRDSDLYETKQVPLAKYK